MMDSNHRNVYLWLLEYRFLVWKDGEFARYRAPSGYESIWSHDKEDLINRFATERVT
jgi:hypothetical protein